MPSVGGIFHFLPERGIGFFLHLREFCVCVRFENDAELLALVENLEEDEDLTEIQNKLEKERRTRMALEERVR